MGRSAHRHLRNSDVRQRGGHRSRNSSFRRKGVPVGTALAFMMAVVGLSFPEAVLLKKVMDTKLILIFFGTVGGFIILLGYFFNLIF